MVVAENIQTMQGFLGCFDPAQAERMAQGGGAQIRASVENAKGGAMKNREMHTAIAENIQTMQTFLGYFNPAQAESLARGCRVQARDRVERTRLADAAEGTSGGPVAENTQTMQTFLGYFRPAWAERMARGCRGGVGHEISGAKDQAAAKWLLQALSALHATLQDGEITIEEAQAEGNTLAIYLAVPNPGLLSSRVAERAFHP